MVNKDAIRSTDQAKTTPYRAETERDSNKNLSKRRKIVNSPIFEKVNVIAVVFYTFLFDYYSNKLVVFLLG